MNVVQRKVLLVEGDDAMRKHLHKRLHKMGYSVILASNVQKALEILADGLQVHFVLVDAEMEGEKQGWAFARTCRALYPQLGLLVTVEPGSTAQETALADLTFPVLQRPRLPDETAEKPRLRRVA